ncbi:hypothetical protein [Synechococcus sp. MU1648]|uniref:hypothetical protein n=1 Tax=Synechococcus sp. MU1648 TaxID=2508351 RepID=UPI002026C20E
MKKTKLFLHIGHGKTGTSAIQSSLAIASNDLAEQGISYPIQQSLRDRASRLEITSGNWEPKSEVSLSDELLEIAANNGDNLKIILSSESLFWLVPELIQNKSKWENNIDMHIILAVREIEEMLSSEYQQRVKRHGDSMPLEQFLRARHFISSHHAKAAEIIELMNESNISNTIINYSRHKRDISQLIFKLVGAEELYPEDQMAGAIINRSLSRKELEMLITINALYYSKFPWISTRISDALIKSQPQIEAQQCKLIKPQLEKVYEQNDAYLQTLNACLDPNEQLTMLSTLSHEVIQDSSPEQVQKIRDEETISICLIGDTLQQTLTNESKRKLSNDTVDAIIELSQSGKVSKTTEVELLEVAKENRPQGLKLGKLLERARTELSKL